MGCGNAKHVCESYGCQGTSIPSSSSLYDTGSDISSGYVTQEPPNMVAEYRKKEVYKRTQMQNRRLRYEDDCYLEEYVCLAANEKLQSRVLEWVLGVNRQEAASYGEVTASSHGCDVFEVFDQHEPLPDAVCCPVPYPKQRLRGEKHLLIVQSQ